ncbi:MAG: hypothetical protein ACO3LN_16810 [bacterium]|jgi:hypothetical protein
MGQQIALNITISGCCGGSADELGLPPLQYDNAFIVTESDNPTYFMDEYSSDREYPYAQGKGSFPRAGLGKYGVGAVT